MPCRFWEFYKKPFIILLILIAIQELLTFDLILTIFYELKTSGTDGKAFEQLLYNIINGNGMLSTIAPPHIAQSWLGVHFSPIIYAIAPIYYLFPRIETLLFLQSFLIALAAIPIFFTCKILLKSQWQALVISIFYLVNPFVVNAQIWDFHEIAFAPLTISLILWAIVAKKQRWLVFFCAILLTIKEHYGLAVFGSGLLWAWQWRDPKFGLVVATIGLISFVIVIKILMPHFSPIGAAAMLGEHSEIDYFSWLTHPLRDTDLLIKRSFDAVFYSILLMAALWFQPIFSFVWLLPALADGVTNSLSNNDMMRHPSSYHTAALIPILLIAYSKTIAARYTKTTKIKRWEMLAATALITSFFSYSFVSLPYFPNNLWELSNPHFSLSTKDENARNEILKIIGDKSTISAQSNILPHIPVRESMYMFPHGTENSQYIIINTTIPFNKKSNVFGIPYYNKYADKYFTATKELMEDKNWGVIFYQDNWLLFKHNGENNQLLHDLAKTDLQKLQIKFTNFGKYNRIMQ